MKGALALSLAKAPETLWTEPFQTGEKTGAAYRCFEMSATYYGHDIRLIVVESSALDKRKENTFAKRVERERAAIEQEQKHFTKLPFRCEEDARQAMEAYMKALDPTFHTLKVEVTPVEQL
uniref:hypothetical protein n=1 Tax=Peribacillus saganii TaxID=2303992 RepID=UPI001F21CE9D|nr:hypothetical protein [Peribacillus saganii]